MAVIWEASSFAEQIIASPSGVTAWATLTDLPTCLNVLVDFTFGLLAVVGHFARSFMFSIWQTEARTFSSAHPVALPEL